MKMNMTFMMLLNFLHVNTQMSGLAAMSKTAIPTPRATSSSHILRNRHLRGRLKNTIIPATTSSSPKSKHTLVDKSTTELGNLSSIELYSFDHQIVLSTVSDYIEKWLLNEAAANTSQPTSSQLYDMVKPNLEDLITSTNPSAAFKRSVPLLGDVRFFQLWKEIGMKNDNGNFTLKNDTSSDEYRLYAGISNRMNGDRYDDRTSSRRVSRMKAILVKDTRYRSLMKKWITNRRHGRARGDFSIDSQIANSTRSNVSHLQSNTTTTTTTNHPPSNTTKSNATADDKTNVFVTCVREHETNVSCNSSNIVDDKSPSKSSTGNDDDPEARFYDPLMPYPEEYPEEYQTIQNGPALIISRTTYTRIPNVTYTTITMVTLPTYRLVEKAENAFAATLFEERSSKSSTYLHAGARCDTKHHSSADFLQHSRR